MYSVVLMAALTTGVDLPDFGRRGGCHGCRGGGYGGCYGGGYGYGYGGCYGGGYGYGYGGCYGGYGMGYGGCMGMGYGGCMGMGYGGCMGMGYGGCYGGYGMGYGGCCGGYGLGYGGGFGSVGGAILQGGTTAQPSGERAPQPKQKNREESLLPAPATIVVDLPADAKLLIDNEATNATGRSRIFQSPTLNPGKEYQYTLKAEVVRGGKPVQAEKVVTVKAGQITPVSLTLPVSGVAQR